MESIEKSCSSFKISQPSEVVNLICVAYDQKVTVAKWKNYVAHNMKEKKAFHEIDHILDSKMEPLVFDFSDGVDKMIVTMSWFEQTRGGCNASKQALEKKRLFLEPQFLKRKNIFSLVERKQKRRLLLTGIDLELFIFIQWFVLFSKLILT